MLKYSLRDILADPRLVIHMDETMDLQSLSLGPDQYPLVRSPHVQGKIQNLDGKVLRVTGEVETMIHMPCSRCMEDVEVPLQIGFEQRFIQENPDRTDPEDEDLEVFQGFTLDLEEFVINEMRLGIPMKPLCREDCKGLCPHCGHNLNEGPCGCDPHEEDPRWDALKRMLQANHKQDGQEV
ncbi:MAG: DUF177 domain-containing protein [Firmicutes bacterium]|nr:DUF177 domain-containing protein [Bacillota bacterium]